MWTNKIILIYFAILIAKIHSWRIFHRGRGVGGNLGTPVRHHLSDLREIPEQWFLQELDHFNPSDDRKWKQVSKLFYLNNFIYHRTFSGILQMMNFLNESLSLYF